MHGPFPFPQMRLPHQAGTVWGVARDGADQSIARRWGGDPRLRVARDETLVTKDATDPIIHKGYLAELADA
jgi:hypothetical protein